MSLDDELTRLTTPARLIVATGHDVAASLGGAHRWRTPSGQRIEEGGLYRVIPTLRLRMVRSVSRVRAIVLGFRTRDHIDSERLDTPERIDLACEHGLITAAEAQAWKDGPPQSAEQWRRRVWTIETLHQLESTPTPEITTS